MATEISTTRSGWKQWKPEQARRALAAWKASGLSLATYARRHGVTSQRLRWWRERLGEWTAPNGTTGSGDAHLVPALITTLPVSSAVTVRLPGDVTLEVADVGAVSPAWVAELAAKLSRAG